MARFVDLPIDLLPVILQHVVRPNHLAMSRLVNRQFNAFAAPRLFEQILIYAWHKNAKSRVNDFNHWNTINIYLVFRSYNYSAPWRIVRTLPNGSKDLVSYNFIVKHIAATTTFGRNLRLSQRSVYVRLRGASRLLSRRAQELRQPAKVYLDSRWIRELLDPQGSSGMS